MLNIELTCASCADRLPSATQGKTILTLLVAIIVFSFPVRAQSTFAAVAGSVRNESGIAVPDVVITLTDLDTNAMRTAVSSSDGQYSFLNLRPSRYSLSARKSGFSEVRIPEFQLDSRQERQADVVLVVGSEGEVVQTASTGSVTENGAQNIDNKQVTQLPANYRGSSTSPLAAIVAAPNVQQDSSGNISLGGTASNSIRYTVDGTSNNQVLGNGANRNSYPSSEIVGGMKVSAIGNGAEFATPGDVTITTKSGDNAFHGSAFEYLQNRALDATTYGSTVKQAKRWNTFGGSLSGPILRNKTFFFVDYEGNRKPGSALITGVVPSPAMRSGNLGGLTNDGRPDGLPVDPTTGNPFVNNQIPADRINSVATKFLNLYYPLPNFSGSTQANYRIQVPTPQSTNGYDIKIDHTFSSRDQLFGRWSWKNLSTVTTNGLLPTDTTREYNRSATIAESHFFTPSLLNEVRFGFNQTKSAVRFPLVGAQVIASLGITELNLAGVQESEGFPGFDFSDGTAFTSVVHSKVVPFQERKIFQMTDNLSFTHGKQTLKAGIDVLIGSNISTGSFGQGDEFGSFTFNAGAFSGNAFADLLLGLPSRSYITQTPTHFYRDTKLLGVFLQNEIKATRNVSLTLGMRWSLFPGFTERDGDLATFEPVRGAFVIPPEHAAVSTGFLYPLNICPGAVPGWNGVGFQTPQACTPLDMNFGSSGRRTYWKNFQPRLGFAWRAGGNTVIRGSLGLFSIPPVNMLYYGFIRTSALTYVNFTSPLSPPIFSFPQASTGASFTPTQIGTYDFTSSANPYMRDAQTAQWSASVERQLGPHWTLRVSYVGSNSYRLYIQPDLNQVRPSTVPYNPADRPYLNIRRLLFGDSLGFANYQAVNPAIEHRAFAGFTVRANYTWAKNLSNANGDAPGSAGQGGFFGLSNRFDLRAIRGNDPGTRRHRLLITALYELPVGSTKRFLSHSNSLVNGILGGWQLSTIMLMQSGPYLTPTISPILSQSNTNELGRGAVVRPDRIANGNLSNPTPGAWWDITAFTPTPAGAGRVGNAGVGILQGPGTIAVAAGLSKVFLLGEKVRLRFEGTFTNLPNHPNFAAPATNISAVNTFGKIVTVQSAENSGNRTGQLSLRLEF